MTVNSNLTVGSLTFATKDLEFAYTVASQKFTMTGSASVTLPSIGSLAVTFGHAGSGSVPASTGLVVQNGKLLSLDMSITSDFSVFGVTISTTNLNLAYIPADSSFKIGTGTVQVSTAAQEGSSVLNKISATFGDAAGPGLAIVNGKLTDLHITLNGGFSLFGIGVQANSLTVDYTSSKSLVTISGGATVSIGMAGVTLSAGVAFPTNGLTIDTTTGKVHVYGLNVKVDFKLSGGIEFKGHFNFIEIGGTVSYTVDGSVTLPMIGEIGGGIKITKDTTTRKWTFNSVYLYWDAGSTQGIPIGTTGLYISHIGGGIANIGTSNWVVDAALSLRYGPNVSFNGHNFSLMTLDGKVVITKDSLTGSVEFNMIGGYLAHGTAVLKLNWTKSQYSIVVNASMLDGIFKFYGGIKIESDNSIYILVDASISLPHSLPWPVGGLKLAEAGLYFQYIPYAPKSQDFGAGWVQLWLIGTVGVQVDFNGHFDLIGKKTVAKYKVTFAAQDGPIAGGTVFLDLNENGVWEESEPTTITAFDGSYSLPGNMGGQLVLVGGTDISTNLPNTAVLTAPAAAAMISPFTTLVNDLMTERGLTEPNAEAELCDTLGIPATITVTSTDIIKLAQMGNVGAAQAFATEIKLANLATMAAAALGTGQPVSRYTSQIYSSLARWIAEHPGSSVNLSDATLVRNILADAATQQGVPLTSDNLDGAATLIAAVNGQIDAIPVEGSMSFLESVVRVQVVAQGTVAPMLAQVAAGTATIDSVLAAETATALTSEVGAAQIGELSAPVISINNVAQLATPDATTYTFTVARDSTVSPLLPVSVDYSTIDGTATAGVDYAATSGTLTWAPGETGPKAIVVSVARSTLNQSAKTFGIALSNAQGAVLASGNSYGVGTIIYNSNPDTTTSLTASTPTSQSGESVTLTATVTDSEGHPAPQGSTVTFYDGSTELGVAFVGPNGKAEGNTTDLSLGTRHLTAVYSAVTAPDGNPLVGASTSTEVVVQVGKLDQTIDFPTPKNVTYGSDPLRPAPVLLQAVSTSGLLVSYRVVSGPATVTDNLLTFTGLGQIVVEATQVGDDSTNAATPVDQTFSVAPAPLTFTVYDLSIRYGDPIPQVDSAFSGFVNGDTTDSLTVAPTISILHADGTAVTGTPTPGTYTIVASGAVDSNYDITYVPATLTVNRTPLIVTVLGQSMVYGSSTPELTFTCTGLLDGDSPAVVSGLTLVTDTGTAATVGTHAITVSGGVAANYDITYVPATLTVTPAPLTITANNQTIVYGVALPTLTAGYTGLVNGDTATSLTVTPTIRLLNADGTPVSGTAMPGTYTIAASDAVDSNYDITYVPAILTVSSAPLTVTADNQAITYGAALPTLTAGYTGLVNGDTAASLTVAPTICLLNADETPVSGTPGPGTYTIVASGAADSRYMISYLAGTLTVARATPTLLLSAAPASITYDGMSDVTNWATATLSGVSGATAPTGPVTLSFYNGSSATGTPLASLPLNAGTYTVRASYGGDSNYAALTSRAVTFTINQATATMQLASPPSTITYDGLSDVTTWVKATLTGPTAAPAPSGCITYTYYSGTTATGTALSTAPISAGTYTVVANYAGNSNYRSGQSAPVTFTIQQPAAPLSMSFKVDDGTAQRSMIRSLTVTFSSAVNLQTGAITLTDSKGNAVAFTLSTKDNITYTLTFSGTQFVGGSLTDGRYALVVHAAKVNVGGSPCLMADQTMNFWRLYGDIYGTASVTNADKTLLTQISKGLAPKYLQYFTYDGGSTLSTADVNAFNQRFGKTI